MYKMIQHSLGEHLYIFQSSLYYIIVLHCFQSIQWWLKVVQMFPKIVLYHFIHYMF